MKAPQTPPLKDLVLIGGGHSHLSVLRRFGMRPLPGLRLTLIARDVHTPYSGMLPGHIAGLYDYDESHIDLRPLAQFAGARLFHSPVIGLDLEAGRVLCEGRPPVRFDLLSINIGSRPRAVDVPGAAEHTLPVKPIDGFLAGWAELRERVLAERGRFRVAVVGGGAGGTELALATQHRLRRMLGEAGLDDDGLRYRLVTDSTVLMPTHNAGVRRRFQRILAARGIELYLDSRVERVEPGLLYCKGGQRLAADAILWVTQAGAPEWLGAAGLETDAEGFVAVDDTLRSVSHPAVFAVGDIAAVVAHPRPKSGVFAVRQGPPLARNLRLAALGRAPRPFVPQRDFLGLISTGDRYAVASRGRWSAEGAWLWTLKDWIDRRFMRRFGELPEMAEEPAVQVPAGLAGGPQALAEVSALAMRCGGCGAKVGSTVLSRVMSRLSPIAREDVLIGLDAPDDAAAVQVPPDRVLVQSVDYFRAFLDDPYLLGRIAANHSLGDIFAMGAEAQTAMAIATVPYAPEAMVEEQLYQVMAGSLEVLNECGAALVGGHSSEGAELAFGLSVTGLAPRETLMTKAGMQPGELLVLTKALGTGTLFAADMRRRARGRWVEGALESMLLSNQAGAGCLHRHHAGACTDVTGFGLLGHLVEMTRAGGVDVTLDLDTLPLLEGALETIAMGIFSSLQPENVRLRRAIRNQDGASAHPHYPLLFDPQTAGGLLASVPAEATGNCVSELRALGYPDARVIGRVEAMSEHVEAVRLVGEALRN